MKIFEIHEKAKAVVEQYCKSVTDIKIEFRKSYQKEPTIFNVEIMVFYLDENSENEEKNNLSAHVYDFQDGAFSLDGLLSDLKTSCIEKFNTGDLKNVEIDEVK